MDARTGILGAAAGPLDDGNSGDIYGTLIVGVALLGTGVGMALRADRRQPRVWWGLMALWGIWVLVTSSITIATGGRG